MFAHIYNQKKTPPALLISDLIILETDMIAAYEAAIRCCASDKYKVQFVKFLAEHEQHVAELNDYAPAANMNRAATQQSLVGNQSAISGLYGDAAILAAMKKSQDHAVAMYEQALTYADLPQAMRSVIEKIHSKELSHRSWLLLNARDSLKRAA